MDDAHWAEDEQHAEVAFRSCNRGSFETWKNEQQNALYETARRSANVFVGWVDRGGLGGAYRLTRPRYPITQTSVSGTASFAVGELSVLRSPRHTKSSYILEESLVNTQN